MDERKYQTVVAKLNDSNNLGLDKGERDFVARRMARAKANYKTSAEWMSALDSIIVNYRNDALTCAEAEVAKVKNEMHPNCLICSKEMEPITLLGGVPAFYCVAHRVVVPKSKEV